MDEEPSTSSGIKRHIPQELQDDIDLIAAKRPHEEVKQIDLDDNQKRHLVVGICLQSVLTPALRKYVHSIFTVLYSELVNKYKIDTQIYPTHLQKDPNTEAVLNYEAVNNNKAIHDKCDTKYDYTIKNAVELSKLFLETHKTHYEEFDKTLNSFALLELIVKIGRFDQVLESDADNVSKVQREIRNPWFNCNFNDMTEWDDKKFCNSFIMMKKLVKDLKLNSDEETIIIQEMDNWETHGQRFFGREMLDLELSHKLRQQTHAMAEYIQSVLPETVDDYMRLKYELMNLQISMKNKIAQYDGYIKDKGGKYEKKSGQKGLVIIVNFMFSGTCKERQGSDVDTKDLKQFFKEELKYQVECTTEDMPKTQLQDHLKAISRRKNSEDYHSLICVIMSHGNEKGIQTKDEIITLKEIQEPFKNKDGGKFNGKPKIFLIQACRGIEEQEHVEEDDLPLLFKSDTLENLTTDARGYSTEKIPADADFIVAYATTPGYISIRDISKGAYFIRAFLTVAKKRYKDEHIEEILIHVKRELASNPDYVPLTGSLAGTCQMGMVESTSRKKLYL